MGLFKTSTNYSLEWINAIHSRRIGIVGRLRKVNVVVGVAMLVLALSYPIALMRDWQ